MRLLEVVLRNLQERLLQVSSFAANIIKIPGLSFSLKRAVGISALKQKVSRATGIPMTKQGLERKIGGTIIKAVKGKKK